jgi:hypothetical protein
VDPGTALGAVSLGVQVCGGLLKYYQAFKGYEDDIRETYSEINSLSKTFDFLDDKLKTLPQRALATRAQECLIGCRNGIQQLDEELKKMHKEAPVGLRQTIEAGSLRWKYPLRKTTLEKLSKIAQELTRPLNLAIQIILLDSGQSIKDGIDATKTLVTQVQATILDTHFQAKDIAAGIQSILSAKDSEELAKILWWLSAPDPSANHAQAREQHEDGTGDWLFESQEYQDWVSGSSPLFWLHGKAGCCKRFCVRQLSKMCVGESLAKTVLFLRTSTSRSRRSENRTTRNCCSPWLPN